MGFSLFLTSDLFKVGKQWGWPPEWGKSEENRTRAAREQKSTNHQKSYLTSVENKLKTYLRQQKNQSGLLSPHTRTHAHTYTQQKIRWLFYTCLCATATSPVWTSQTNPLWLEVRVDVASYRHSDRSSRLGLFPHTGKLQQLQAGARASSRLPYSCPLLPNPVVTVCPR